MIPSAEVWRNSGRVWPRRSRTEERSGVSEAGGLSDCLAYGERATQHRRCVRRQDARAARTLNAGDDGREALMVFGAALCAHEHHLSLLLKNVAEVVVSEACEGDDNWSGAGKALTFLRRRAKCGVSDGGEGWSPP